MRIEVKVPQLPESVTEATLVNWHKKPGAPPPKQSAQPAPAVEPATAMPAARKMMADKGVDAATVTGSGRGGRITKEDVAAAVEAKPAPAMPSAKPAAPSPQPSTPSA